MKNIDELKNEIEIPVGIDLAIKKGIEKGRNEKRLKKKLNTYKKIAVATAASLLITTAVGVINPNIVKAIPGIESIFKLINYGYMGENFNKFEQFSTSVNKTVEKNGIKVTIDEIVIDDNTLAVTSIIEGENLRENRGYMGSIRLNGRQLTSFSDKDKMVEANKLMVITYGNVSDMELPEDIDVGINIGWIDEVKGPWDFKFKISKVDKATNSRVVNLDKTLKLPDSTLTLDKLVISPLGNTITYKGLYQEINEGEFKRPGIYSFIVMDDKGKALEVRDGNLSSDDKKYEGKIEILNDLSNMKSLTVVPILKKWGDKTKSIDNFNYSILQTTINSTDFSLPQEVITKSRPVTAKEKSDGYGFDAVYHVYNIDKAREFAAIDKLINQVIKVGENSTALIKNIEATSKETKITFKLEGSGVYNFRKINYAVIIDEDFNDIGRAEDGPMAELQNVEEGIVSLKLSPIDTSKKYKIALPIIDEPQIEDKYKITFDITEK